MKTIRGIIIFLFLVLLGSIVYLAFSLNPPEWTGFGEININPNVDPAKTLWDWLELLIIPLAIGLLGWSYNEVEKVRARNNEAERAKNESHDSFVKIMTELIIDYDLISSSQPQIKAIAKTRVNLALNQFDGVRKGQVLQFIYESDLIDTNPILSLLGANFNDSLLDNIVLIGAEIRGAYFENVSFKKANLNEIILNSSNLSNADLSGSLVKNADFSYSDLSNSRLKDMDLTTVNFEGANLTGANLKE